MGFWSSVASFVGSVASGIGSAISAIGSGLSSFAMGVGRIIAGAIEAMKPVAEALGNFANAFLQAMGILKPEEKIDEIGERALQAADRGITIEKFENFEEYMKALRDFPLDPEVSARRSPTEKLVAGLALGTVGVEKQMNLQPGSLEGMWLLPMTNPEYFTPERMKDLVTFVRLGADVFSYLEMKLSDVQSRQFEKGLAVNMHGQPMSEGELAELYRALDVARDNWAMINRQIQAKNYPTQGE